MDRDKLFNMLGYSSETDDDDLGMILSNNADMGSSEGCLISVKKFEKLTEDIKQWRINKNAAMGL